MSEKMKEQADQLGELDGDIQRLHELIEWRTQGRLDEIQDTRKRLREAAQELAEGGSVAKARRALYRGITAWEAFTGQTSPYRNIV